MNGEKIDVEKFLELSKTTPVCDVRSPMEYNAGHIPGAVNIPLFSDYERETVGKKYKKEGRLPAINKGLSLIGTQLSEKLGEACKLSINNNLLVHCWRGGMRSESMAWLFSLAQINVNTLEGGYKSYRHHILEKLSEQRKMIILGGFTGSGKTHIINYLKTQGQQAIDMEGLANHKGSAFGALGQNPQPTTEYFANILYNEWAKINPENPVWLEDESRNIGSVFIPEVYFSNMQKSPVVVLMMDIDVRLPRLLKEYSLFPKDELKASVIRISKRLGSDNANEAIKAIENDDFTKAIKITLTYYDKAYLFGLSKKDPQNIIYVKTQTDDIKENTSKILEAADKIKWRNFM